MSNHTTDTELRPGTAQLPVREGEDRAATPPQPNSTRDKPPAADGGHPTGPATHRSKQPRSTATVLLTLAGVLVAVLYGGSLIVLGAAVRSPDERASWNGSTLPSAMLAMFSLVATFVLAFSVAVRNANKG